MFLDVDCSAVTYNTPPSKVILDVRSSVTPIYAVASSNRKIVALVVVGIERKSCLTIQELILTTFVAKNQSESDETAT